MNFGLLCQIKVNTRISPIYSFFFHLLGMNERKVLVVPVAFVRLAVVKSFDIKEHSNSVLASPYL